MNVLKVFFKKTRYFWAFSRLFLIVAFSAGMVNESNRDINFSAKIFTFILFSTLIFGMIFVQIMGLLKSKKLIKLHQCIKIYIAVFSIFFGFFMFYLLFFNVKSSIGFVLLPIWLILFGVYEFSTKPIKEKTDYISEIDEIGNDL